jgi:uncharacterized repeat protein (TIGR02543 family)
MRIKINRQASLLMKIGLLGFAIIFIISIKFHLVYAADVSDNSQNKEVSQSVSISSENPTNELRTEDGQDDTEQQDVFYNVTFKYDGKVVVVQIKEGEKVTPPVIRKIKNTIVSWSDNDGNTFDFNTSITSNITLTLHRNIEIIENSTFHIFFYTNGGTKVDAITVIRVKNKIPLYLPKTTRAGYEFLGWFDTNGKKWEDGITDYSEKDTDLYAHWQKIEYTDTSPKTADENNIILYALMLICGAVICGIMRNRNKKC